MNDKKTKIDEKKEELLIIELDERLEFSAAVISSDLDDSINGYRCVNNQSCDPNYDVQSCSNC